jgi:hypothetical protein
MLPTKQHTSAEYAYLRQSVRTNNAAIVAEGAAKPTSVYSVVRVENSLQVIAHLSEGIPRYWLLDNQPLGSRGQRAAVRPGPGRGDPGADGHQRHGHIHLTPLRRVQGGLLGEQRRGILVDVGHHSSACLCPLVGAHFTK